jgi:5-(carboxyamino)imidazole ribonucleotide synthase
MAKQQALPKDSTIGVLGGGQLGMMLAEAAPTLGYRVKTWAQSADEPAVRTSHAMTIGGWDNSHLLNDFLRGVGVVTYEFENVSLTLTSDIEAQGVPLRPSPRILRIGQDRWQEKNLFMNLGIPFAPTSIIVFSEDLKGFHELNHPSILKTCNGGYDGKGQRLVSDYSELQAAWEELGGVPCVLESRIDFDFEMSIIVARNPLGQIEFFPAIENEHEGGILRISRCPGPSITPAVEAKAREYARSIAESLGLVGLLTVEFFVTGETVFGNEIAPRPHNSGHGTREACTVSQFEQHLRAVAGMELIKPELTQAWTMENLIGTAPDGFEEARARPGAIVTDYGKAEARPGRKMGHVVFLYDLD